MLLDVLSIGLTIIFGVLSLVVPYLLSKKDTKQDSKSVTTQTVTTTKTVTKTRTVTKS